MSEDRMNAASRVGDGFVLVGQRIPRCQIHSNVPALDPPCFGPSPVGSHLVVNFYSFWMNGSKLSIKLLIWMNGSKQNNPFESFGWNFRHVGQNP